MRDEERVAAEVVAQLREIGIDAVAKGQGVHWRVSAYESGGRSIVAHCFWYERSDMVLLGMNPANARAALHAPVAPYHGFELAVDFVDDGVTIANGRTRTLEPFLAAARRWLGGAKLEDLVAAAPFVDARKRASRSLAAHLERELGGRVTWSLGEEPSYELWIYGAANRMCRVLDGAIHFFVGQAQAAFCAEPADIRAMISAWLVEHASLAALAKLGAVIERHAEVLEVDPSLWHWLHVRDRVADPNDVLAPLAPLLSLLADSPIASRFYTYSSLDRLCFSASSHFPWVGEYPMVTHQPDGAIHVGDTRAPGLAHAVTLVEAALAASPIEPFFGCAAHHELAAVEAAFGRAGSHHTPTLIHRQQWTDLGVVNGTRRCTFVGSYVTCSEGDKRSFEQCATLESAVAMALAFLDA